MNEIDKLEPLISEEYKDFKLGNYNLVRIRTPIGPSSIFHAIVKSYNINYYKVDSIKLIENMRTDLSNNLDNLTNYNNNSSLDFYSELNDENTNNIKIDTMKKALIDGVLNDLIYIKYISDQLNKNIYLIDGSKGNGKLNIILNSKNNRYINRDTIILLIINNHYELIGYKENDIIRTYFNLEHKLIQYINR